MRQRLAGRPVPGTAMVPTDGGRTVVTSTGPPTEVRVVDPTGAVRWQAAAGGVPLVSTRTGTVVVPRRDGGFDGRLLSTGTIRWRVTAAQASAAQLVLAQARDVFATGNAGHSNGGMHTRSGAVAICGAFNDVYVIFPVG